jgi:hypothetical protein
MINNQGARRTSISACPSDEPTGREIISFLQARRGSGESLHQTIRAKLERLLSADLSSVRIHRDDAAQRLTSGLKVGAFAHGEDLFFAPGQFCPHEPLGLWRLAHENVHTLQQRGAKLDLSLEQARGEGHRVDGRAPPSAGAGTWVALVSADQPNKGSGLGTLPVKFLCLIFRSFYSLFWFFCLQCFAPMLIVMWPRAVPGEPARLSR